MMFCQYVGRNYKKHMTYPEYSREIWQYYHKADWQSADFCPVKSYVCSLMSELAYEHIPEYELSQQSRIKIFPSESYMNKIENQQSFNIAEELSNMEFSENFLIESENLIIMGIKLRQTLFISIRGTQSFSDAMTDIDLVPVYYQQDDYRFHFGFLNATLNEKDRLIQELSRYSGCDLYFTGHSLGGAIAAITQIIMGHDLQRLLPDNNLIIKSCYTFGMPRYGNRRVVDDLASPFTLYKSDDMFPLLPPRIMGFRNAPQEYKLAESILFRHPNNGKSSIMRLWGLLSTTDLFGHSISKYRRLLKQHA